MSGLIPNDEPCMVCGARRGEEHGLYRDPSGEWIQCEYEEEEDDD